MGNLHESVSLNNVESTRKLLIESSSQLNDGDLEKLVSIAIVKDFPDQLLLLLEFKDSIKDKADNNGVTPLILGAINGSLECVKLLMDRNSNVNAKDSQGNTALHKALLLSNHNKLELLKALLDGNADPKIKNIHNKSVIELAKSMANKNYLMLIETNSR